MVVSWILLPLSLAAPVFYQLETAPTYLQWIARFNPLAWQVDAIRATMLDGHLSHSTWVLIALTFTALIVAVLSVSHGDALNSEGGK